MLSPYPLPNQKELTTPVQQGEVGRRWEYVCEAENIPRKDTVRGRFFVNSGRWSPNQEKGPRGVLWGELATLPPALEKRPTHDPSCT